MTQEQIIYDHLKKYGSITSMESFALYGITRLSARIHDLRHQRNAPIRMTNVTQKNRSGKSVTYAKYSLEEEDA